MREIELSNYLPDVIKQNREFKILCNTESKQINQMWKALEIVFDNSFLESLTEYGCSRWENILQIIPDKSDTLAIRRKNIWIRLNENLPYTWKRLVLLMNEICGENGYHMELIHNEYFLDVSIQLTEQNLNQHIVKQVMSMFERVLPANIAYKKQFRYDCPDSQMYIGSTAIFAYYVDVLPYMPTFQEIEGELFTDAVVCAGVSVEIKEG